MLSPHSPLPAYYRNERDRSVWVRGIFDRTAGDYDRIERLLGLGTGLSYRRRALRDAGLMPPMTVLDIGTGTGLMARAAAAIVGDATRVTGVDPSSGMVDHAKVPVGVRLLRGSAEAIPAADAGADFLCMGYALRHINDLTLAFTEFHRVVRPGGRICILEITLPSGTIPRALLRIWLRKFVPVVAALIAHHHDTPELVRYYWDTIQACVPPQTILRAIADAGFVDVERHIALGIFSEYRARRPG